MMRGWWGLGMCVACVGATSTTDPGREATSADTSASTTSTPAVPEEVSATVLLDGSPVAGAWVGVGGAGHALTDELGTARLLTDGGDTLVAGHPDARTRSARITSPQVVVDLERFSTVDNTGYTFEDPGEVGIRGTTAQCAHCHQSALADWDASAHRTSASNPVVHDVYAGAASALVSESDCVASGGRWWTGLAPGTGSATQRCYIGSGTLPDLNPDCGGDAPCDGVATEFGGCADCHAPGIDGALGGRDLLEAVGRPHDKGVHCDVCHKVESVDLDVGVGVAGALQVLRPTEPDPVAGFVPLTFGPYPDVPNPRMGAVARELFRESELCGACHELHQPALIPGTSVDPSRWPDGVVPVHTTYSEWAAGPYAPTSPCQSCHMPPDPRYDTSVDWVVGDAQSAGVAVGWPRPPGAIRRHTFDGPRTADGVLLGLAAALDVGVSNGDTLEVTVTVTNSGAGHALPTGEPSRSVLLLVTATCKGTVLSPVGGDVVPAFGGALDEQGAAEDWSRWPGSEVGDRIRSVHRSGWRAYVGPGRFGDGSLQGAAGGLPSDTWADEAVVVAVDGDEVTLDHALEAGDVAYRVRGSAWAGAPGFGFARVLADSEGGRQVAHHRAVDVVSDNRLLPLQSVTTKHSFEGGCDDPDVVARLVHRNLPLGEARLRRWTIVDRTMVEVRR